MSEITPLISKTFRLDADIAAELEDSARREDRTMTAIIERALRDYFAKSRLEAQRGEAQPETRPA